MSKKTRQLVVFLSVLVVLAGCALALVLSNREAPATTGSTSSEATSSEDKRTPILVRDMLEAVHMKVANAKDTYNVEISENEFGRAGCEIEGLEGLLSVGDSIAYYILENMCNLKAQRTIGEVDDHMAYGLVKPSAKVEITFNDGTKEIITVGSEVPDGKYYHYIMREGDENVYVAQIYPNLFGDRFLNLTTEVVNEITYDENQEEEEAVFGKISITSDDFTKQQIITNVADEELADRADPLSHVTYKMEPGRYPVSPYNLDLLVDSLLLIEAETIAATNPTQADMEKYGLADPYRVIEYTLNYVNVKLTISRDMDGVTYYMRDDTKVIFASYTEDILWATFDEEFLHNNYVFTVYTDTLESVTVDNKDGSFLFEYQRTKVPATEEGKEPTTKSAIFHKGKELIYNDWSKTMQNVIGVTMDEVYRGQATVAAGTEPDLRITLNYSKDYDREDTVIEIFDLGNRKALYRLDGVDYMIVPNVHISHINNSIQRILEGKSVTAY